MKFITYEKKNFGWSLQWVSAVHTFEKMINFKIIFEQISHSAEGAEGDDDYSSHASTKMFHPGQLTSTLL